ncbi:MAG: hypothetical protein H0U66_15030 [Gemmatimonadaceae bacterium]|nr:hypothetical protein [Gemmatimonadaceae bacterium]
MIALALLLALQGASQGSPHDSAAVQMGTSVMPDTVTVGEHFVVRVRVRAPKGAEIGFPVGPDSGVAVEAVDPRREAQNRDTTAVERTATYRLVAWTVGAQRVTLGTLVVSAGGVDRRFEVPAIPIVVKSVRPADSTGKIPRPARSVMLAPPLLWPWIAGALVLLALALWMLRRMLRRRPKEIHAGTGALADAERDFARIDELALIDAGERGRYVALHIDVLREYLAARIPEAARSLTSTELLAVLSADAPVPLPRLVPVLAAADLIKYADRPVTASKARELASESRGIVGAVEEAVLHRVPAAPTTSKPEKAA